MGLLSSNNRVTMLLVWLVAGLLGQVMATGVVNDTICSAYSAVDTDEYW